MLDCIPVEVGHSHSCWGSDSKHLVSHSFERAIIRYDYSGVRNCIFQMACGHTN